MKRKLFLTALLLFFSFSFSSNPPGWYVQQLPVNDFVNDIFFLDSLNGWLVTDGRFSENDTSYIMRTTNGGDNWTIQNAKKEKLNTVRFLDINTGYASGGLKWNYGNVLYKTTNGGTNWLTINNISGVAINDMFFLNKDTGWVCDDDILFGGLYKTTNGSISWIRQLDVSYKIQKIFFLNKDTGWACNSNVNGGLYKTNNGGGNWEPMYEFPGSLRALFFINSQNGWVSGAFGEENHTIQYTINGGANWTYAQGEVGGFDLKFVNDSIGYAGGGSQPLRIIKSTNGGRYWGYQSAQTSANISVAVLRNDPLRVWAGRQVLIHTTDGGGVIVNVSKLSNGKPSRFELHQNYPNPFNPKTIINYELGITNLLSWKIYDVFGNEITTLVNEKHSAGSYSVEFDGSRLPSGIYFYRLETENFTETKKMVLAK
ncbi:MAG: T9SS type A sorting domain-containing protein [Ignavibacteria bacterium]|nr:T9SS type A sorting domain-containing protein [Ignavibacteria bacterium]